MRKDEKEEIEKVLHWRTEDSTALKKSSLHSGKGCTNCVLHSKSEQREGRVKAEQGISI